MSSKKPGLFSRIKNSISTSLNEAVDSVSDPGQEVALMLDDLASQIQSSERDLKQTIVDRKMLERKVEEFEGKEKEWQRKAEQALKLGDEELARAALKRKADYTMQAKDAKSGLVQQADLVESMHKHIKESKARLKSLNLRRGSLMAQARAAKRGFAPGDFGASGTVDRMNAIENRIAEIEALNEVNAELNKDVEEAALDAKLAQLDDGSEVDDALAALKAKLSADKKSLKSAD
jgi:phage shock protein A